MKKTLFFILSILIIVTIGFVVFGIVHAGFTKERFIDDLETKAKAIAESMEITTQNALANNDLNTLNRLVQKFQKRKNLQGCIIYDKHSNILAVTERFAFWKEKDKADIKNILVTLKPVGTLEKFQNYSVYNYVLPILNDDGEPLGLIEVIYDTSYMFNIMAVLWERISITLIGLIIILSIFSFLVQRRFFLLPVQNLTSWLRHFQNGNLEGAHSVKDGGEIGQLANEVEQVALSLRVVRNSMSEKAQLRVTQDETWTEIKLKDLIHAKLLNYAFFVVSNREPFMHITNPETGRVKISQPPGGVVTAIDPILRALGGMWIAHGSGNADKKFVNSKDKLGVPPNENSYILKRVWLTKEEESGYYDGFSNEGLWPLCLTTFIRPIFRATDWEMYKQVNQKFADAILAELPDNNPFVFIQDYHFVLLAKMIKAKRPDATIALFWHIPWPSSEVFLICPYRREILEGMLSSDLIGFHVQNHCNNFLDTVNRLIECRVDMEKFSIKRGDKETLVRSFPISINTNIQEPVVSELDRIRKELDLEGKIVAVGVDRIDPTKGIIERLLAIDRFLDKYPQYKNKFVFIQIASPSRTRIDSYRNLINEIDALVEKQNWKHTDGTWKPIIYIKKNLPQEEIYPYYALADIAIVSSLHDGMNLVAKEYVAAKSDLDGVLILSRFTGAARELTDALLINPYSIDEFAETIHTAISMPLDERKKRMTNMRKIINDNNIYKWAASIISELAALKKE